MVATRDVSVSGHSCCNTFACKAVTFWVSRALVEIEVAVLGSPSLTVLMVAVDVRQHWTWTGFRDRITWNNSPTTTFSRYKWEKEHELPTVHSNGIFSGTVSGTKFYTRPYHEALRRLSQTPRHILGKIKRSSRDAITQGHCFVPHRQHLSHFKKARLAKPKQRLQTLSNTRNESAGQQTLWGWTIQLLPRKVGVRQRVNKII